MLRASIGDLTLLVAAAANGGVACGRRLLSAQGVRQMLEMQHVAGLPSWLTGQGLGWAQSLLDGAPRVNHWGGDPGVFTMAYLAPERRSGVVLLSNTSATAESRDALKSIVARLL
jgi:CubicO group peptidase (beta-lactamase class C family)